jgi:hypothetical protein
VAVIFGSPREKAGTPGEKSVLKMFGALDDDCIVYAQPKLGDGFADFVVILPSAGVFVVEVKDWEATSIKAEGGKLLLGCDGEWKQTRHPHDQAEGYEKSLRDGLRKSKFAHAVMTTLQERQANYRFPVGHLVILTNTTRAELEESGVADLFPPERTLTKEALSAIPSSRPDLLYQAFRNAYAGWRPFPPMDEDQVAVVRSVISPETVIVDGGLHLNILDQEQKKVAGAPLGGHRLVYGPAGTGKTVVLVARVKRIAADAGKRVLVLCYNVLLAEWLRGRFADFKNVDVRTFHAWGVRHGVSFDPSSSEKVEFGLEFQIRLMDGGRDREVFDAIFVDEGQEFPKEWFECVMLGLKDRTESDLFIAGDGAQSPAKRKLKWINIGIIVNKGDRTRRFKNVYRCTKENYEASRIPLPNQLGEKEGDNVLDDVKPGVAVRSGLKPALIRLRDREEECRLATALIESWLLGGFEQNGRRMRVAPQDVAVLYPFRAQQFLQVFERFRERLSSLCSVSLLERNAGNGSINDPHLKLLTIQRSKGLQFRHVILLWTDFLRRGKFEDTGGDAQTWLHVAMTRAEFSLTILHSQDWDALSLIGDHLYPNH